VHTLLLLIVEPSKFLFIFDMLLFAEDMLGAFPPKAVQLKRPFAILPWTKSEENIANFLMVFLYFTIFNIFKLFFNYNFL